MEKGITDTPPTDLVFYIENSHVTLEGVHVPGVVAKHYKKFVGPHHISMGVYESNTHGFLFRVWGVPESAGVCCRYHQIFVSGAWGRAIAGPPRIEVEKTDVDGTILILWDGSTETRFVF